MSRIAKSLTIIALAASLAACGSSVDLNKNNQNGNGSGMADTNGIDDPFNPNSRLAQQRSVYFEFNDYNVSEQYRGVVEMHGKYLVSKPGQRVVIEGNTDARGGAEYNLALGQRRAEAVRRMLGVIGVPDSQIETISFGKEKPKALGNTDADYAQNRRADFAYKR